MIERWTYKRWRTAVLLEIQLRASGMKDEPWRKVMFAAELIAMAHIWFGWAPDAS